MSKPPAPAPSLLNYFFRGKRWKNFYLYRKEAQNKIIIGTKVNSGQFYSPQADADLKHKAIGGCVLKLSGFKRRMLLSVLIAP